MSAQKYAALGKYLKQLHQARFAYQKALEKQDYGKIEKRGKEVERLKMVIREIAYSEHNPRMREWILSNLEDKGGEI